MGIMTKWLGNILGSIEELVFQNEPPNDNFCIM
jgi:hypothetical protein